MPTITTKEATIQTFQVEIQTLRVNNKQVTMGLFRQLPLGELIDSRTLMFKGLPWGHVQYWWDGDGSLSLSMRLHPSPELLHIVWQSGDTLHRAIVDMAIAPGVEWYRNEEKRLVTDYVLRCIPMCTDVKINNASTSNGWPQTIDSIMLDGKNWNVWIGKKSEVDIVQRYLLQRNSGDLSIIHRIKLDYDGLMTSRGIPHDPDVSLKRSQEMSYQGYLFYDKWESRKKELRDLPQLFIAV